MSDFYTSTENRPDLAALPVDLPEGYISNLILPVVNVTQETGAIYYMGATAVSSAQTDRSTGAAPTVEQISTSNTTFTCAEAIDRAGITPDQAKVMGGIEKADMVGATIAKRNVMRYKEDDVAALVMKSGSDADEAFDAAKAQTQIQDALDEIVDYAGLATMITSTKVVKAILQNMLADSAFGPALSRLVGMSGTPAAMNNFGLAAWRQALAIFFGVDQVLVGLDEVWNASAISGRFAIAKVDDGSEEFSHLYQPVLGKTFQFLPDGEQPWYVDSVGDRSVINNLYTAKMKYDAVILNSSATYVFDGVAL